MKAAATTGVTRGRSPGRHQRYIHQTDHGGRLGQAPEEGGYRERNEHRNRMQQKHRHQDVVEPEAELPGQQEGEACGA